jgi:nucleotide-binding universal stress UspA family protein
MTTSELASTGTPQRVVVGVDGSPASLQALQWALSYASATHSQVREPVVLQPVEGALPQHHRRRGAAFACTQVAAAAETVRQQGAADKPVAGSTM